VTVHARRPIEYAEFYITNVCNFNCSGCNRFNNYHVPGSQKWQDYQARYQEWSRVIDIAEFTIMGGEPMTNPDYLEWLQGIHQLWPVAQGSLLTNGHYLRSDDRALYEVLQKSPNKLKLNIGLHNIHRRDVMLDTVKTWLKGKITVTRVPENLRDMPGFDHDWHASYQSIRDQSWPDCDTIDQWSDLPTQIQQECEQLHGFSPRHLEDRKHWLLRDENGVTVMICNENYFAQDPLRIDPITRIARLHHSDPVRAHAVCDMAQNHCYHFIRGKMYKCGPVALWPELVKRFQFDITQEELDLVMSYEPGEPGDLDKLDQFLSRIDEPLAQCRFCPENKNYQEIQAEHGKKILLKTLARSG